MKFKLAVCVLVLNSQSEVLAISRRHKPHLWGFPGGKLDPGESSEMAVIRECQEELGHTFEAKDLVPLFSGPCYGKDDSNHFWVTTYGYRGPALDTALFQPEAGLTISWMPFSGLLDESRSPFAEYNQQVAAAAKDAFAA